MRVGLYFDLRNPTQWHKPWKEFYNSTLCFIAEAERLGIDIVYIAEHHLFGDGYIPQPLIFLSAIAARTDSIRLSTGILTLPLHNAVDVAEQAAVIDSLSGGRLELAFGGGYRLSEYELFGVDMKQRFKLFEQRVIELRKAWERVTPRPVQDSIPLWAGVLGPKSNRMAGRLGMGRLSLKEENWDEYLAGLREGGHDPKTARLGGYLQGMLADDPELAMVRLAPQIEHNWNTYNHHHNEGTGVAPKPFKAEECIRSGFERVRFGLGVMTVDDAVKHITTMANGRSIDTICFPGAVSGVIDDIAYRSMELIATKLKPMLA